MTGLGCLVASSSSAPKSKHDVFLNFRGADTRCTFTSHLYAALCRNQIQTFIDDKEINRGDTLSPTLLSAIETSKIAITIFSQNYASSAWCLDELQKIIECKKMKQLVVIPVFYHIDPSDVRHQRGSYEDAFTKHEEHFRDNLIKVNKWRTALRTAANSAGWDSSNTRLESELVENIVEDILQKLGRMSPHVSKELVGIARHIAHVESLLCSGSSDVRIVGIWGMGGIGKTTIADALCAKLSSQYQGCYSVANVREEWKNNGEVNLRNKLLSGILGIQNLHISTLTMSSTFIVERLQHKKVLVVLDDVSDSKQIEYLVGEKYWFGPGSRIIVTTRYIDVFDQGVGVYQVMEMNFDEALELFSLNAFQQDHPMREYIHLSKSTVEYAKGIPLALKVLGSYLHSKRPEEWESALEKLKKIPKAEIYDALRLSYDSLDHEEKDIFLDIACCLKGETKCQITRVLDGCGFSTDIGMRSLQDKSLITISKDNTVKMHDLIQEMGWQIVREESMKQPGKRSRLWDPKEIYDVLKNNRGTDNIESIALDTSQIKEVTISPQAFHRMYKLRLLNFHMPSWEKRSNVHISRGLECMPDELTYLRWDCFPLKSLPPSFCAEKLVELNLKHSLVEELWDGVQDLANLKSLYLSGCNRLIELPDFSMAQKLEEVHLDDCTSLLKVPSSILSLDSLFALNLRGCKQLRQIQSEKQSRSLQWLTLTGCSRLVKYAFCSEKLKYLSLDGTGIEELPALVGQVKDSSSISHDHCERLPNLPNTIYEIGLDSSTQLLDCPKLEKLPPTFDSSFSMTTLYLDNCSNLSRLPDNLGVLSTLNKLSLRGSNIENLPSSIKHLSQLRALNLSNSRRLRSLPELPLLLQDLNASNCVSLETVSNLGITVLRDSFGRLKKFSLLRQIQEEEKMSIRQGNYLGRFEFYNCISLGQIARKTIMEEALIRIQLAAYLSSMVEECWDPYCQTDEPSKTVTPEDVKYISRPVYINFPGNEVPDWFVHKGTDNSIITFKLSAWWHRYFNFLGFGFCLVLGPSCSNRQKNHHIGFMAGCRYYIGGNYVGTSIIKSSCSDAKSDQLWLWYDRLLIEEITSIINKPGVPGVEVSFDFFVRPHSLGVVKQCGIQPLYAPICWGLNSCLYPYVQEELAGILGIQNLHVSTPTMSDSKQLEYVFDQVVRVSADEICIVGIWGMGGIGKTTIVRALCAKLCSQYEGCYIVVNMREGWEDMSSTFIEENLQRKTLLVVLDDMNDSKQIEYWFGPGGRITLMSRNKHVFVRGVGVYPMIVAHAFTKHEEHFRDNLNKWRTALREAANLAGWDFSNIRPESKLVEDIVKDVLQKLGRLIASSSFMPPQPSSEPQSSKVHQCSQETSGDKSQHSLKRRKIQASTMMEVEDTGGPSSSGGPTTGLGRSNALAQSKKITNFFGRFFAQKKFREKTNL